MKKHIPYTVCNYTKDGKLYDVSMYNSGLILQQIPKKVNIIITNRGPFLKEDWETFANKVESFRKGYEITPDCKNCEFRFKCWTGNIKHG